jgi:penicillin-binding protein 1B
MTTRAKSKPKQRNGKRDKTRRRLLWSVPAALLLTLAGALALAFVDANWRFARSSPEAPVRVMSASFALVEGASLTREDLVARLHRLGYREVEGTPRVPGEYARRMRGFDIALNHFDSPAGPVPARTVRVRLGGHRVSGVEDAATGRAIADASLDPEPLGILSGDVHEDRLLLGLGEMPDNLRRAVIAVEDRRFLSHPGFDVLGILRALLANVRHGEVVQGGSTITQQLAKNLYHDQDERTVTRKIWETLAAISLEMAHSKDEILERYLNEVYLAQRGPVAIIGVGAAANHYFGKEARYLDLPEAALLAGLIQSPGRYHPYRHPDAAVERRNVVLALMREAGFISEAERAKAAAARLTLREEPSRDSRQAPYFVDYVRPRGAPASRCSRRSIRSSRTGPSRRSRPASRRTRRRTATCGRCRGDPCRGRSWRCGRRTGRSSRWSEGATTPARSSTASPRRTASRDPCSSRSSTWPASRVPSRTAPRPSRRPRSSTTSRWRWKSTTRCGRRTTSTISSAAR